MGLLDFDEHYKPPFKKKVYKQETGIDPLSELNNLGHEKVSEDYSDELKKKDKLV